MPHQIQHVMHSRSAKGDLLRQSTPACHKFVDWTLRGPRAYHEKFRLPALGVRGCFSIAFRSSWLGVSAVLGCCAPVFGLVLCVVSHCSMLARTSTEQGCIMARAQRDDCSTK